MFDRKTILIAVSALVVAVLSIDPTTKNFFPFWVIYAGASVGDTMFHELGHSVTGWLLGVPNLPAIMTVFGADQQAGITLGFGHFWILQIAALGGLAFLTYDMYQSGNSWFYAVLLLTLIILAIAISGYYETAISYMGHGGAITMGGYLLYRFWRNLSMPDYERWLSAFFGFFMTIYNIHFAYKLVHDANFQQDYNEHVASGIAHNDFMQMSEQIAGLTVHGIAMFTVIFAIAVIILSFCAGIYKSISADAEVNLI